LFTNVPGSREDWYLDGKRIIAYGFGAAGGLTPMTWAAISHKDNIKVSLCADRKAVKDIRWVTRQFEANLDKFLEGSDWRKWNPAQK
jgi:S-adenosylmethionine synthetase